MFGKLKDKLKSWVTKSKEDIEEKAEKVETPKEEKPASSKFKIEKTKKQ